MNLEIAIGHLLIGPLTLLISCIFAKYPPKKLTTYMGTEPSAPCVIKTVGILQTDTVLV